jgi:hypothetical protein
LDERSVSSRKERPADFHGWWFKDKTATTGKESNRRWGLFWSPNTHDSRSVKLFKSRALKRHEGFNGMTKSFQILRERFRHGPGKIGIAFEAVAVICQDKIEAEEPLWDVLKMFLKKT